MHAFGSALHAVYLICLMHYVTVTFLDLQPYDPLDAEWKSLPEEVKYFGMTAKDLEDQKKIFWRQADSDARVYPPASLPHLVVSGICLAYCFFYDLFQAAK